MDTHFDILEREKNRFNFSLIESSDKLKSQRLVQNFIEMGIPKESILQVTQSNEMCTVLNGRIVSYQNEGISLTALTKRLLNTRRPLRPSPYWQFEGGSLSKIYDATYE